MKCGPCLQFCDIAAASAGQAVPSLQGSLHLYEMTETMGEPS